MSQSTSEHRLCERLPLYALPFAVLLFFGSLGLAAALFPKQYDWRYRVISNLLSPRDAPHFFWIPCIGIALAGILLIPFARLVSRRLRAVSRPVARVAAGGFYLGFGLLILSAMIVPQHIHPVLGFPRLHEMLARSSAVAIGIGMIACCVCGILDGRRAEGVQRALYPSLAALWLAFTALPLAVLAGCGAMFLFVRMQPQFAVEHHSWMRHSLLFHLGFWEWIGTVVVFAFIATTTLLLPRSPRPSIEPAGRALTPRPSALRRA